MTIRQTLLVAFVMFSIIAAALMTVLAYTHTRAILNTEIRLNLENQAMTVVQQIDAMLFERVNNVQGWGQLDLMQEIRVGDVDKRLSRFLRDIEISYAGVYSAIFCVRGGVIVAASDAAMIGFSAGDAGVWLEVPYGGRSVAFERPDLADRDPVLAIHTTLEDAFTRQPLGYLHAQLDWTEVSRLLDNAVGRTQRLALLIDHDGRVLAASSALRKLKGIAGVNLTEWGGLGPRHGVFSADGRVFGRGGLVVGFARSTGYRGLPDIGWNVMILTPQEIAYEQTARLLWTLIVVLGVIALIAVVLAFAISGRIARPLQALTTFTRKIRDDIDTPPVVVEGSREVAELSQAFNTVIEDLQGSRGRLIRAAKLAAVGEMAASLGHELRTPLGIMRSSAQLLSRQQSIDERGREMLDYMLNECDRINELIGGLLDSSRPRDPEFEANDINEIVAQVVDMLRGKAAEKRLSVEFSPAGRPCVADCDRGQIIQVLLNLLMNALQILPEDGHVYIKTVADGDFLRIDVDDDGPGIPEDQRAAVLEPFVSHRKGGIGLGLSIVHEIVQMHRGTIEIGSNIVGGASFKIRLPIDNLAKT